MKRFIIIIAFSLLLGVNWADFGSIVYGDDYVKVWDSGSAISNFAYDAAVGDTDEDGKSEIIVSSHPIGGSSKIYVFENDGDNSYQLVWDSGTKLTMRFCLIEVGDQDSDGMLEIIAVESRTEPPFNGKLHVFENIGDNCYQEVWNNGNAFNGIEPTALFLGDADNDGNHEIIVGTGYQCGDRKIRVYENTGDNAYLEVWNSGNTPSASFMEGAVGDTDGDSKMEIIVGDGDIESKVRVFENIGDDSYDLVWDSGDTFSRSVFASIGDQDGDGKAEIIAAGRKNRIVHIFENTGDNTYTDVWNSGIMNANVCLATVGDQDLDGKREIIVPCEDGKVYVFENTGDNDYQEVWNSADIISGGIYRVATGDQDKDGKFEFIAPSYDECKVYVFEHNVFELAVPIDIKPRSCPNRLNVKKRGVLRAAILGTDNFDVAQVDIASLRLEGVAPIRSASRDVATPFEPFIGKVYKDDCNTIGPDGFMDLILKFNARKVIRAIGKVKHRDIVVLQLRGSLREEFGGTPIKGEDVVVIININKK